MALCVWFFSLLLLLLLLLSLLLLLLLNQIRGFQCFTGYSSCVVCQVSEVICARKELLIQFPTEVVGKQIANDSRYVLAN